MTIIGIILGVVFLPIVFIIIGMAAITLWSLTYMGIVLPWWHLLHRISGRRIPKPPFYSALPNSVPFHGRREGFENG